jgi:hypothetical protein
MKKPERIRLLIRFGHLMVVTCTLESTCGVSSNQPAFIIDFGFPLWVRTKRAEKIRGIYILSSLLIQKFDKELSIDHIFSWCEFVGKVRAPKVTRPERL